MAIEVSWHKEYEAIITYTFQSKWTWGELNIALEKARSLVGEITHRVDVIIFYDCGYYLPDSFITNLKGLAKRQLDNAGLTVIVTNNKFIQQMFHVSQQVDNKIAQIMYSVETEDEALDIIKASKENIVSNDPSL